jgi:phytoene dehydrogenase-like protein
MSQGASSDAIVIGGGINGLAAAAYLARAGRSVILAEARDAFGGLCEADVPHALHALDPRVVKELKLVRHGLKFAVRDMALVALRPDGRHLVLSRDVHASARSIAIHSRADAEAWPGFRRELLKAARALRPLWWDAGGKHERSNSGEAGIGRAGVAAWLESCFESEAIRAALSFDATLGGTSPLDPASASILLWRAAQEMCGHQGASAMPLGGAAVLAKVFVQSARAAGVDMRTEARVQDILVERGAAAGVRFSSGETVRAPIVISSLARRHTLLGLAPVGAAGFDEAAALDRIAPNVGTAKLIVTLDEPVVFAGVAVPQSGRFVLAERVEGLVAALAAARAGRLPGELSMEFVVASAGDTRHVLSVLVRPVPLAPPEGWQVLRDVLKAKVIAALERHINGLSRHVVTTKVLTPEDLVARTGADGETGGAIDMPRLFAGWQSRICTPVAGLFLCGADAEPVGLISGRAPRIAARFACGNFGK